MPLDALSLVGFAFTAGAFTFFAPCAYPLLPGYVSYYLGRSTAPGEGPTPDGGGHPAGGAASRRLSAALVLVLPAPVASRVARAVVVSALVSAGFFLVYGALAGVVAALGASLLADISVLELVVGALLVAMGTAMALGWDGPAPTVPLPKRRRSAGGYLGFGVLYAAAAAGCTAPVFIAVALEALSTGPGLGLATFGAYAAGMSALMLGVTVGTALGRDALLVRLGGQAERIHRLAGVLLVLAGVVQLYFFLFRFDGLALLAG